MKSTGMAYLLWSLWFLGFAGIHRFYLGKPISGLIWFLTWGLFGIGQIFDLLLIPDLVERENFRYRARLQEAQIQHSQLPASVGSISPRSDTQLILKLLSKQSEATLADCVLATERKHHKLKLF